VLEQKLDQFQGWKCLRERLLEYHYAVFFIIRYGAARVAFRAVGDWGRLQTDNPADVNYWLNENPENPNYLVFRSNTI
jgi:hypothetical protein